MHMNNKSHICRLYNVHALNYYVLYILTKMDNIEHFAEVKCIRAGSISKTLLGDGEVLMAFVGKKRLLRDSWRREQRRGARRGGIA